MKFLSDNWTKHGSSLESFKTMCEELTNSTIYLRCGLEDLVVLSYVGEQEKNGKQYTRWAKLTHETLDKFCGNGMFAGQIRDFVLMKKQDSALDDEIREAGIMLMNPKDKNRVYLVSRQAFITLSQRVRLGSEYIARPSLARDIMIARNMQYEGERGHEMTLILRKDMELGAEKVFAAMSPSNTGTSFMAMYDMARDIISHNPLGEAHVIGWQADHQTVSVSIEFPEAAVKYQKEYGLTEAVIPGITLMDSDTGDSSLVAMATMRPENSCAYAITKQVSKKHAKGVDGASFFAEAAEELYRYIPQVYGHLAELAKETICPHLNLDTSRGRKQNRAFVEKYISRGYKSLGFGSILSREAGDELVAKMSAGINPARQYTFADIAMMFLDAPSQCEDYPAERERSVAVCAGGVLDMAFRRSAAEKRALYSADAMNGGAA